MLLDIDYHPRQGQVSYQNAFSYTLPPTPLNRWVQSFWQLNIPSGKFSYHSVPDNCVDWIINLECFDDNIIVTPFIHSIKFELTGPLSYFGIRFHLFGHQGIISSPVGEWNQQGHIVDSTHLIPDHVLHASFASLTQTMDFKHRCKNLSNTLLPLIQSASVDPRLFRFAQYCLQNTTSQSRLSEKQCSEFGISARQLRRLAHLHLGLAPKDFARVLRFQHALKSISSNNNTLTGADHYYDQSHFIHEFKYLTGLKPMDFINMSVLYNHS